MELKRQIEIVRGYESTKHIWRKNINSKEYKESSDLAKIIAGEGFNRSNPNCGCIDELFILLKSFNEERINFKLKQMNGKFKLFGGKVISFPKKSLHLTNANLTDELAIELLKVYPAHIVSFEVAPGNWRELVSGTVKMVIEKPKAETVKEEVEVAEEKELTLLEKANILADEKGVKRPHWKSSISKLKAFIKANS